MAKYIMALKGKGAELNSVIWNTQAASIHEAKEYFVKLKNLAVEDFDRLFVVAEVGENGINTSNIEGSENDE